MKKFTAGVLLSLVLAFSFSPVTTQAATRAEVLEQVKVLIEMVNLLQKQLELMRNAKLTNQGELGLFMKNISNPSNKFENKTINSNRGDRIAVGWTNKSAESCIVRDNENELKTLDYSRSSETDAQLGIHMPAGDESHVYYITLTCKVAGRTLSDTAKISYLWGLEKQPEVTNMAEVTNHIPTSWYQQVLFPSETKGLATIDVKHLYSSVYEHYGEITPPRNCVDGYDSYFRVTDSTGLSWYLHAPSCDSVKYSVKFTYHPFKGMDIGHFSPEVILLTYENGSVNNYVQARKLIEINSAGGLTYR